MKQESPLSKILKFTTPSKFEVTIREQDGSDDEIISQMKNATDGSSINKFTAAIVMDNSITNSRVSSNDIIKWKVRDKYFTLLKSRIFSLGPIMLYKHTCSNPDCQKENNFEEDLTLYDRDFSKPDEQSHNGFKYQVQPYTNGLATQHEWTTSSGKKLRYTYLNGESEKKLLDMNKDNISKNTELSVRNLEWEIDGKYTLITNFKGFSSREMQEIRKELKQNDDPFEAITEATCPFCRKTDKISLMAQPDFFFPGETL